MEVIWFEPSVHEALEGWYLLTILIEPVDLHLQLDWSKIL